jgi:type I restriction enzyme M protein
MHWIAPPGKSSASDTLEKHLLDTADQFRANSGLKAQEYSGAILRIIFLRFAEVRSAAQRAKLERVAASSQRGCRVQPFFDLRA